jgi:saccharopine dehydrogenase (NAD+, L-lysine forming)
LQINNLTPMNHLSIGIIKEGKVPVDRRTPLTPEQCRAVMDMYPHVTVLVQSSKVRSFSDDEYRNQGVNVVDTLEDCDIIMGVKEVPVDWLMPHKTYMFFSHTIKQQPQNKKLLQEVLRKNITLIDYECLTDEAGERVVAFGRYAGIVGAYNGLRTYGQRFNLYDLTPAYQCKDLAEMQTEYQKIKLPPIKILVTGRGRVAKGAEEVLKGTGIQCVSAEAYLKNEYSGPVYTLLASSDYYARLDGQPWDSKFFYKNPEKVVSVFSKYLPATDLLIAAAFWHPKSPVLFKEDDMRKPEFKIRVIADITCDIDGSIPSTKKATEIVDPVYDFNPFSGEIEEPYSDPDNVSVMAIDNLPCELPRDASQSFGEQLIKNVFPALVAGSNNAVVSGAIIAQKGNLCPSFEYLQEYARQ